MASLAELWDEPQTSTRPPTGVQPGRMSSPAQQQGADDLRVLLQQKKEHLADVKPGTATHQRILSDIKDIEKELGVAPSAKPVVPAAFGADKTSGTLADLWETTPVTQQAPEQLSGVRGVLSRLMGVPFEAARQAYGIGEAGAQLLTGAVGAVPAGLAGLGAAVLPGAEGAGAEVTRKVQEALTYQPRTEAGKQAAQVVAKGMEMGAMGAPERGQAVLEATGSPAAAVLAEQLTNPLNYLPLAPAVARGAKAAVRPITRTMGEWKAQIEPTAPVPPAPPPAGPMPQLVEQFRQKKQPQIPGGSVGAAGVTKETEVNSILANSSPELQQRVRGTAPEAINTDALQTRALEEKHGINLSVGQRTSDRGAYASEWNNRGAHPDTLAPLFENQPKQMMDAIDNLKGTLAPDVYTASPSELGQTVINALRKNDEVRVADINSKYQALRDAAGGELPVDAPKLLQNIQERLKKNLQLTDAEGMSQFKELQRLAKDNNMTYDAFLAMRKNLATEARTNTNGTIRNIAGSMIEELEKLPLRTEVADLQPLAEAARQAARERFKLIESNPAYKEAVSLELSPADIEAGIPAKGAELFIDKHARQKGSLLRLLNEVGRESPAHQAIRMHELEKFKTASGFKEGKGDFTPRGMTNYLHNTRDKLLDIYGPEGVANLQELSVLGGKIAQPKTGVFNQSNTAATQIMEMAKSGISSGLEGWAAAHTGGLSLPVTQAGKRFWQSAKMRKFGQEAIDPYGGIVRKD